MNDSNLPIRVVLADDHEIFRDGFRAMLKKQPSIELIGEAEDGKKLVEEVRNKQPDIVITDIKMPNMDGIAAAKQLKKEFPQIGIIALSMFDEENLIVEMLEAGAKGYLLKNAHKTEIVAAVQAVYNKQIYYCNHTSRKMANIIAESNFNPNRKSLRPEFNEKELQVIHHICEGLANKQIAEHLNLSVRTIEGYRERIQDKMDVHNSIGIVVYAIRNRLYKV